MCRLFGLVANRPVRATYSLLEAPASLRQQSLEHPDGWGIGYYAGSRALTWKRPEPASNSPEFHRAVRATRSTMFIAHVRTRTAGSIALQHTHPFRRGHWMLAQNGGIGGRWHHYIRRRVGEEHLHGHTSGEHLLAWFYHEAAQLASEEQEACLVELLQRLCRRPEQISSANFVLTTGERMFAFRFAPIAPDAYPLYFARRAGTVLVASQRIQRHTAEQWQPLPNGTLLTIDRNLTTSATMIGVE